MKADIVETRSRGPKGDQGRNRVILARAKMKGMKSSGRAVELLVEFIRFLEGPGAFG